MDQERVFAMRVADVYPLYVAKVERKGRTRAELDEVVCWLTGYDAAGLRGCLDDGATFAEFFAAAPALNPNRRLITGTICGIRVENMDAGLMQEIRYLDKVVDELAKGKAVPKIMREGAIPA
jgi:hypothetical protein